MFASIHCMMRMKRMNACSYALTWVDVGFNMKVSAAVFFSKYSFQRISDPENAFRAPFWIGSLRISLVDYVCSNPLNARVLIPVDGHYARIWSCDLVLWVLSHESCALVWVCLLICSWYVSVVQCRLRHCECSSCNMKWSDTCATKICSMSEWNARTHVLTHWHG